MALFISKSSTVQARQYDSELPLTVVHNDLGEQVAHKGDWLVGEKRGLVYVLSDDKFQARFEPFTATPTDDALKTAEAQNASLTSDLTVAKANVDALVIQVHQLEADKQTLAQQAGDTKALSAEVADLTAKLAAADDKAAQDEQKLADLVATAKAAQEAQKVVDDSQAKINQQLG